MSILINHPALTVVLILSFLTTVLIYLAPCFVCNNLVVSDEFNLGTFCGTLTHKNWAHWCGNIILLLPFWIYLKWREIIQEVPQRLPYAELLKFLRRSR